MLGIFILGIIVGIIISVIIHAATDDYEWKQICTTVRLNQCCNNAYNYGVAIGKQRAWESFTKENRLKYKEVTK